jgi:hypothetical protein
MSMRQGLILEVINLHLQHLIYPWREHGGEAVLFPSMYAPSRALSGP